MADVTTTTDDSTTEFMVVFDMLVAERVPANGKLDVAVLAMLRLAARLMTSDDPRHVRDLVELMKLVPPAVRHIPAELSLDELADPTRQWDVSVLDDQDLDELDRLAALATGRAEYVPNVRRSAALKLARELDGVDIYELQAGERRELAQQVALAVSALVRPLHSSELYPVASRDEEVRLLKDQIDRLQRDLHMAQSMASGKVTSLAEARRMIAESEAPIVRTSSIDRHAGLTSSGRFVGDHPDIAP
jgi:hypothetical protein